MEIPRFKLGQEYNQYFYKFVPAMELSEDGNFVKYHELQRVQEELEKCYAEIERLRNGVQELRKLAVEGEEAYDAIEGILKIQH